MNKSDLIEAMAANAGVSKAAAGKALDAMMKSITGELMTVFGAFGDGQFVYVNPDGYYFSSKNLI